MSNNANQTNKPNANSNYLNVERIKSAGQYAKLIVWWVVIQIILGGLLGAYYKSITDNLLIGYLIVQAVVAICILYSFNGMANDLINVDVRPSQKDEIKNLNKMLDKGIISQEQFDTFIKSLDSEQPNQSAA